MNIKSKIRFLGGKLGLVIIMCIQFISLEVKAAAPLPEATYIPLNMAQKMANAALKECEEMGHRVGVAVVDRSGIIKVLILADQADPHVVGSSTGKAYTAGSLGKPTSYLAKRIKDMPETSGLRDIDSKILILGGGLPIIVNNERVGGIGVGGTPDWREDEACAQAGIDSVLDN